MRLLIILFSILFFTPSAHAQKKLISEARSQIKSKSNLDKAESSMRQLIKDSDNRDNIKIYETLAEAVKTRYEIANEQFYLKQKSDTATLFKTAQTMFLAYEALDSAYMRTDKTGKTRLKLRKKYASELAAYRPNLYIGGLFFAKKQAYADAYSMFDTYLQCATQPLFEVQSYTLTDSLSQSAAFWTVFCGFKMNAPDKALTYKDVALASKDYRERTLTFLAETYQLTNDSSKYINTLKTGITEYPTSQFFFTRIMDYHSDNGQFDSALQIADIAVKKSPTNTLFLFGKCNALLNLGRYEDCLKVCDTLLSINDSIPEVYYNAGVSYVNMALTLEKDAKADRAKRNRITAYYKMAQPYLEKFRQLAPSQQNRWAPLLYSIYLKLNLGKQFEEISRLLGKSNGI